MNSSGAIPLQKHIPLQQAYEKKVAEQKSQLKNASRLYEKQFLNEMVRAMRKTVNIEGGVLKKSFAEKLYAGQLDDKYVDSWSKTGGVGLAKLIYNQLNEKYFNNSIPIPKAKGPMDINVNNNVALKTFNLEKADQKNSKTFHLEPENKTQKQDIKAPWPGKIDKSYKTEDGKSVIEIKHDENKIFSKLVFPGEILPLKTGEQVLAGQKVGEYNPGLGIMAWGVHQI
jgi:Rod binding domain-containing protein